MYSSSQSQEQWEHESKHWEVSEDAHVEEQDSCPNVNEVFLNNIVRDIKDRKRDF